MKLWRRRPLSEDLSRKDLNIPDEMPPTLVYISPGNQRISKRSSLANNIHSSNFQDSADIYSFRNKNAESNVKSKNDYRFQTFMDCECKYLFKFDEKTLEKNNISNKECKSYLPPVSQEWSPVKDVMKICRSASVPFHFRNSEKPNIQEINNNTQNFKSPHLSLSEKIKFFFRNRSTSRPSKPPFASTLEKNSPKPVMKQNKGINRISRSRIKDMERCKSLYEPKQVSDTTYLQNQNQLLGNQSITSSSQCVTTKSMIPIPISKFDRKNEFEKKDKAEKNISIFTDIHKPRKVQIFNSESSQKIQLRKFSSPVSTQTTSSGSRCKSNSHLAHEDHNYQKIGKHNNLNLNHQGTEFSASNFSKNSYGLNYTKNYSEKDTKISYKPPETKITSRWDKTGHLNISNAKVTRSNRIDSKKTKQENEYLLPNRIKAPVMNDTENKFPVIDHRKYNNSNEEDYVTLAEVNMSSPIHNTIMTQSLYSSVLPDYLNPHNKYENKEINIQNLRNGQQKNLIIQKDRHRVMPVGEIRKRPISCMTVVSADCTIPLLETKNNQFDSIFSKSPYLSQYSKLYSLRTNIELDLNHRYRNETAAIDLMTRSQHPSPYKLIPITKDQTGKLSIDSGLVDDINAFHPDCLQLTQDY